MLCFLRIGLFLSALLTTFSATAQNWADRVKFMNDFRLRTEYVETTNSANHPELRQRLRARLGFNYDVNEEFATTIKLASGSNDPVSTNETLDNGATKKGILIEEAFVEWKGVEDLKVFLGKSSNVFYAIGKNEMIWDHDLRPEGMSAGYVFEISDSMKLDLNAASYWIDAAADDAQQVLLNGFQAVASVQMGEWISFDIGSGIYDYSRMDGHAVVNKSNGNSNVGALYTQGYQLIEGFIGMNYSGFSIPFTIYFNHVSNISMKRPDSGLIAGFNAGKVKNKGDIGFRYNFRRVEADAVLGAFTDSDFNGGATNAQGHEVGVDFGLATSTSLNLTYFNNKTTAGSGGNDYHRGQLDLMFVF